MGADSGLTVRAEQSLLGGGVALVVQPIELQCLHDRRDITFGGNGARLVGAFEHARYDQRRQHAENHDHHHDLDERETAGTKWVSARRIALVSLDFIICRL